MWAGKPTCNPNPSMCWDALKRGRVQVSISALGARLSSLDCGNFGAVNNHGGRRALKESVSEEH